MASRAEVTARYAKAYVKASKKKDGGLILDQVMPVTGWSRDNARRRLAGAAKRPPGAATRLRSATTGAVNEMSAPPTCASEVLAKG
jgi:hypothetical protein